MGNSISLLREKNIGCLPVVRDGKLVGLVTAHNFLTVSAKLFEEPLRDFHKLGNSNKLQI